MISPTITANNWGRAAVLGGLCTLVLATRVFVAIDPLRIKLVQAAIPATMGVVDASTKDERGNLLHPPFALIARIRHDAAGTRALSIRVDGRTVCEPALGGGTTHRVDCVVKEWSDSIRHEILIAGPDLPWTLAYLEVATHHGNLTGVINAFVLPRESNRYVAPGVAVSSLVAVALVALLLIPDPPSAFRGIPWAHHGAAALALVLFALVLIAPLVSPYRIVLSVWSLVGWTCLLRTRLFGSWAVRAYPWILRAYPTVSDVFRDHHRRLAWGLAVVVTGCGIAYGSRALGAADTFGYVSEADLWLKGSLKIDQSFSKEVPWPAAAFTFSPFGYTPDPQDDRWIVPTYAPGLPLMLAAAKKLGGQNAMFFIVPLSAGLLVLATYWLGGQLGSETMGLVAAWLVATSPTVLGHAMNAMTDVPVAAAWAGAFCFVLRAGSGSAVAAGLLASVATLIRPNLVPLVAVLALQYLIRMWSSGSRRDAFVDFVLFGIAALPGPLAVAAINQHLFGSPLMSGYGKLENIFALDRLTTNLRRYLGWVVESHTPVVLAGLAAIFVPLRRLWPQTRDRRVFVVIDTYVATVWILYCGWLVFETWWFSRFLLSTWPFMMLGLAAVAAALSRLKPQGTRLAVGAVVIALGVFQVRFAAERGVFGIGRNEHRNVVIAQLHRQVTEPNSVTICMIHSGSIRYYGGRMTLNWAWLDGNWLDRVVDWLRERGVHTYVVIEDWEMAEFGQRFAGAHGLEALAAPPIAMYVDPGKLMIFDLTTPLASPAKPVVVTGTSLGWRAVPPVALSPLVFRGAR